MYTKLSDLSVLKHASTRGQLKMEPYPHIVIENALDDDLYQALDKEYPSDQTIYDYALSKTPTIEQNRRYQITCRDSLTKNPEDSPLTEIWYDFVKYHSSPEFLNEVIELFRPAIKKYHPWYLKHYKPGQKMARGITNGKNTNGTVDCLPGINSPCTKESSVRGAHLDLRFSLYGGLFYMRQKDDESTGGDLVIYEPRNSKARAVRIDQPSSGISMKQIKEHSTVPYQANTFVIFLNTPISVHGVTARSVAPKSRRLVNFIGRMYKFNFTR